MRLDGRMGRQTSYGTLLSFSSLEEKASMAFFHSVPIEQIEPIELFEPTDDTTEETRGNVSASPNLSLPSNCHGFWQMVRDRRTTTTTTTTLDSTNEVPQSPSMYLIALAFGQGIAMMAASSNAASYSLTTRQSVNTQFFQLFLVYMLLSIHLIWIKSRGCEPDMRTTRDDASLDPGTQHRLPFTNLRLQVPWWIYLIMSMLDVFPNYLVLFSYRYASLTSTTLLGSLASPATMLFSKYILARVYKCHHYCGVVLCLLGGSLIVWADFDRSSTTTKHSYIGDILAIAAALIYGFGDTAAEFFVKHVDRFEYIGMLGVFGAITTGISFPFFETADLVAITKMSSSEKWLVCGTMAWFVVSVFIYYVTATKFLTISDATLLNLSLQATNVWAILFSVVMYHDVPSASFYVALVLVLGGTFLYEVGGVMKNIFSSDDQHRQKVPHSNNGDCDRLETLAYIS